MRWQIIACGAALALLATSTSGVRRPSSPRASTAERMSVDELIERADLVYEGRVLTSRAREASAGRICTDYLVAVGRTLRGAPQPTRTLCMPGGVLPDGRGLLIPGLPHPSVGDEFLWLLCESPDGGMQMPIGLAQGSFRLLTAPDGQRLAVRSQGALTLVDRSSGRLLGGGTQDVMPYAELLALIEAGLALRAASDASDQPDEH